MYAERARLGALGSFLDLRDGFSAFSAAFLWNGCQYGFRDILSNEGNERVGQMRAHISTQKWVQGKKYAPNPET